jgi:predicted esterase
MRRSAAVVLILALISAVAFAPAAAPQETARQERGTPRFDSTPQRYLDELFADVEVTPDVQYNESLDEDGVLEAHVADIYEAVGDTETARPLVIWIHGGGFSGGDEDDMAWAAEESARRGYVAASISYRLRDDIEGIEIVAAIRDALFDAQASVRFFRANAATYGIDPDLIVIGGYSAGAITALQAVFNEELAEVGSPSSSVAAAVSAAGAYGGTPQPGDAPIVMFHGTEDDTVPYPLAEALCDDQLAAGNVCQFHAYEGEGHILLDDIEEIVDTAHDFLYFQVTCGLPFSDVAPTDTFCFEIDWMASNGISSGYADGTFRPRRVLSRQAAVAFLWGIAGSPDCGLASGFPDVPPGHLFEDAVAWATGNEIVDGFGDGTFRPLDAVSRGAFAAFLWRVEGEPAGAPDPGFDDVPPTHPFHDAIAWAADEGIVEGYSDGTFRPGASVTRQTAAVFLERASVSATLDPPGCPT